MKWNNRVESSRGPSAVPQWMIGMNVILCEEQWVHETSYNYHVCLGLLFSLILFSFSFLYDDMLNDIVIKTQFCPNIEKKE